MRVHYSLMTVHFKASIARPHAEKTKLALHCMPCPTNLFCRDRCFIRGCSLIHDLGIMRLARAI